MGFVKSKVVVVVVLLDVIEEEEERVINREKKERERGRGGDEEGIVSTCLGGRCDVMWCGPFILYKIRLEEEQKLL